MMSMDRTAGAVFGFKHTSSELRWQAFKQASKRTCYVMLGKGSRGKGTDGDRPDHVDVLCVVCNACLSMPSDYYFSAFVGFGVSCPWFYGKFP
jgi:hypothetical protein